MLYEIITGQTHECTHHVICNKENSKCFLWVRFLVSEAYLYHGKIVHQTKEVKEDGKSYIDFHTTKSSAIKNLNLFI